MDRAELSSNCASCAGASGDAERDLSRSSRASKSARKPSILAGIPFEINCLCRRSARVAALEERFLGIHQQLRRDASARAAEAVLAVAARKRAAVQALGAADDGVAR
jgi:hypothetical protein